MQIPVGNLYYILCYALSEFFIADSRSVSGIRAEHPLDLLCSILVDEADALVKRGLHHGYASVTSADATIRGRIDFQGSIKSGTIARGRVVCDHDELVPDSDVNLAIKSTLLLVSNAEGVNPAIRKRAGRISTRFPNSGRTALKNAPIPRLNRNLKHYSLAIGVCRLIRDSIVIEASGATRFVDFTRDDVAMRDIFERFVRNFLQRKLKAPFGVTRRRFPFAGVKGHHSAARIVPTMTTDAVVSTHDAALIIEVKFVPGATSRVRDVERLRSPHLYQLYSYLSNYPAAGKKLGGLFIYPAVKTSLSEVFSLNGVPIGIEELRLEETWSDIEAQLLDSVVAMFDQLAPPALTTAA